MPVELWLILGLVALLYIGIFAIQSGEDRHDY